MRALVMALMACALAAGAQQTAAYSQYLFNKAGLNPAASGTLMDQKYFFAAGVRRQWTSFDRAPSQNFMNLSYTLRQPRAFRYWQNFSIYGDTDDAGLLGNDGIYLGYTFHWLLRKKHVLSFGLYAGARQFSRRTGGFDMNDPAVREGSRSVIAWPDVIPGVRFSTQRSFIGISARNLSIRRAADLSGREISAGSYLQPVVYVDMGRRYYVTENLIAIPSAAVHLPLVGLPVADLNLTYYYATRIGAGLGIRNASFLTGMFQVRFLKSLTVGFAYSYPINSMRLAAQNTYELMIGMVPYGLDTKEMGRHSVSRCPDLSY